MTGPSASEPPGTALPREEIARQCRAALRRAGAQPAVCDLLTEVALYAEDRGHPEVGVAHLLQHVDAMDGGRLDGSARPEVVRRSPVTWQCDAVNGIPQLGFQQVRRDLVAAAGSFGLALFTARRCFTAGPLGWFVEGLAREGLVAVAVATSPAVMAGGPGTGRVYGTNPLAFAVPQADGAPVVVDQASSAAASVAVARRAQLGELLPDGWALDDTGAPTRDPLAALAGSLLPFGGYKGGNIALLVELLSGLGGGRWSMDSPAWDRGEQPPGVGVTVLVLQPDVLSDDYRTRVGALLTRLRERGVRLPGQQVSGSGPAPTLTLAPATASALEQRVNAEPA